MGDIYMTRETGSKMMKMLIFGMVCFLLLMIYVLWQSYEGRVDLVNASRSSCERGKLDRRANGQGWRTAQVAREKSLANELHISYAAAKKLVKADRNPSDPPDLVAARKYDTIASGLEKRSRIVCNVVFPNASFIP